VTGQARDDKLCHAIFNEFPMSKFSKPKQRPCPDMLIKARLLFLRYAFPCAGITLARGKISQQQYNNLEKAVLTGHPPSIVNLTRIFGPAWRRINRLANLIEKSPLDPETIRTYFLKFHNQDIKQNDGSYAMAPEFLKKLCRVEKAKIIQVSSDFYLVKIRNKKRAVSKAICPRAKVGDIVAVHYGYAVEKFKKK